MKRIVLIFTLLLIIYDSIAQNVGISETSITPHPSAMLEVRSSNKGILIPRVVLIQTTLSAPIANPQTSLLVYNTATQNDVYPGYYYWDGAKWVRLLINQDLSFAWLLTGNNISPQHFIGTLNNEDFKIYTNNSEKIRITTQGFMGIGTSNPLAILHVKGNIRHSGFLISEGNYAKEWMKFDETPFGHSLILGAGALTVVGGGESSDSVRANIPPSQECLILSSDETGNNPAIQFITSVQSGWGNRVVPMTIVGNGKIGIGTISPTEQLHVKGSVRFEGVGAGTTETTGLVVDASGNVRTRALNSIAFTGYTETDPNAWRLIGNSSTNPSINFIGTTDNVDFVIRTNNAERARVSNVGNVGIGTSSPTAKLHVNGSVRFEGVGAGTTETTGLVVDVSGNVRTRTLNSIAFTGYTETDPNAWRLIGNSSTNPSINFIGTTDNVDFVIRTNNIERARVSNVGNVGIGTSSPSQKLTVNGNIGLNAGVNSFIGTLSNTDLLFYTNNGEKMRLTKSGDLYVGSKNDTMRYLFDWMFPQPPGNFSSRVHIKKDYGVAGSNPTIYCPLTITSIDTSNYTPPPIPAHFGTYIEAINKRGSNSVSGETYGIIATAQADTLSKFYRLTGGIFHSYSKSNALTNQSTMTAIAGRINYQGKGFVEKAYGINLLGQNRSSGTLKNYCGFYSMVDNISTGKYDTIVMYYSQVLGRCKASVLYGQQIFLDSQYIKPQKIYGLYILNKSQTVNPNDNWGIALYGFNKNYISGNLDVGGTLTATACICPSDLNLKSHIYPIPYGLKDVLMLKPVAFEWKDNHQHDIGLIAQDVMGVIPEVVRTFSKNSSDSSYYALDYAKLTSVIIKAMQEQQAMIEQQQKISEEQRTIINQQQKEIDLLKKQIQVLSEEIKKLQTTMIANGSASK